MRQMIKIVSLLTCLAPVVLAQGVNTPDAAPDSVIISRRALTLSAAQASADSISNGRTVMAGYNVALVLSGQNPVAWFKLEVAEPVSEAAYGSALRPVTCRVMTDTYSCRDSATVVVANGRLAITIRDSAMLALMFAQRPTAIDLRSVFRPRNPGRAEVRYIDPQLLPPSKEALAEYDRALGRDGWSAWNRQLWSGSPVGPSDPAWAQVGQRLRARVTERQCRPIDSCNEREDFSATNWTSSDSAVVSLTPLTDPRGVSATIFARHPGTGVITVKGLHGPSDDLPRSTRITTLACRFVVTNRWARVQITPRPTTVVSGSEVKLEAQLIDENGAVIPGAPVNFLVIYDWVHDKRWSNQRYDLATRANLTAPGRRRFIAYFANFADTLDVDVVPRQTPPH